MTTGNSPEPERRGRKPRRWGRVAAQLLVVSGLVAVVVWANLYAADHELVRDAGRRFGYVGVLIAGAISGFNLVVPVPVVAFFPFFMEIGLEPVPTVIAIATGMTTGDLLGYLLGRTARELVRPREGGLVRRLEAARQRHPHLPLLIMLVYAAVVPAPNELLVLPLAFLRYPVWGIFGAVLVGNLVFNSMMAFGVVRVFAGS